MKNTKILLLLLFYISIYNTGFSQQFSFHSCSGYKTAYGKLLMDETKLKSDTREIVLSNLEYNTSYNYELQAVSKSGVLSKLSPQLVVTTDKKKK